MVLKKTIQLVFLLALGGFLAYFLMVNVFVGVLVKTGMNMGNIEELISKCVAFVLEYTDKGRDRSLTDPQN